MFRPFLVHHPQGVSINIRYTFVEGYPKKCVETCRSSSAVNVKFLYCNLTFIGPCIMIYSYNKNQRDALISQIYFGIELYMFRTGLLSIIRSLVLYTQQ